MANDRSSLPSAVVVLDAAATVVGEMDKIAAHGRPPTPHLAFSVVLFDSAGATLLQRRSAAKYHFAGRWSNACCSHPRPGEPLRHAARRRIAEELDVHCDTLEVRGAFWYFAEDTVSGLVEHEYDVVLIGRTDDAARPNPAEASDVALRTPDDVLEACVHEPSSYTPWLPMVLKTALGPAQRIAVDVPL